MILLPHTTVGEAASQFPETIRVFHRLRVQFCCDGRRTLDDLCRERQLSFEDLAAALAAALAAPAPPRQNWSARPLSDLTAHIIEAFHEPLRQELPRLRRMAVKVQRHTDSYRHVLAVVLCELERFSAELVPHMASEERELFPLVGRMETGPPHHGDAARVRQLRTAFEADHAEAGQALQILRSVTGRYEAPPRACATLRDLYRGLTELEQLMQLHIHLENNVLFPRAAALGSEAGIERS
jgi:regulator of cell morphogenesis and NO signaling